MTRDKRLRGDRLGSALLSKAGKSRKLCPGTLESAGGISGSGTCILRTGCGA